MSAKKVQILMSTYNGEKYLREQIDSLLAQKYEPIEILIRDDGSKDGTCEIIKEYAKRFDNIKPFYEENLGVNGSFFTLLSYSDADYIAFCDQDDIWLPEKIEKAVNRLSNTTKPTLYCSNKILVDSDGNTIKANDFKRLKPGFKNALVESICTGCTIVMNRKLADDVRSNIPKQAIIHDWWVYLVASYTGNVIYDKGAYIKYRQHANNVLGQSAGFLGTIKDKARYLKSSKGKMFKQLTEFKGLYRGDKSKDDLVDAVLAARSFGGRLKIVFGRKIYRQQLLDGFVTRMLFLINRML